MIKQVDIPNQEKQSNIIKSHIIKFRVDNNIYKILQLKSLENKMGNRPHKYARKIIEENLKIDDSKIIKKGINDVHDDLRKTTNLVKEIMKWTEFFTQSFFASMPEIPKDQQEAAGQTAEKEII